MKTIVPVKFQAALDQKKLILNNPEASSEQVPLDVLFVGAGPAGLAGAIELAKLVKQDPSVGPVEIGVLEKAEALGNHNLSGAVINPIAFKELFPDMSAKDFPFRGEVNHESVYLLTKNCHYRLPTPPTMKNKGNFVASISEVARWLGQKAEELGVNILTQFPAQSLIVNGNQVQGVRTTPAGLNRSGEPGSSYMAPTDISAKVTVLTEGTRGPLTNAYLQWQNLQGNEPQIFALGVKEVWKTPNPPKDVIHTLGWPLPLDTFGGSFMYPMGDGLVAFGLVAGLDYKNSKMDVHHLLQNMKKHPLFAKYLKDGEIQEWGAKTIPEGGWRSLPKKLHGDGILMAGDCVGLVNVPALKGIHYAMMSGIFAARTIFAALKAQDFSAAKLSSYDEKIKSSFIAKDLQYTQHMRHVFKDGFFVGGAKAAMLTAFGGKFPGYSGHAVEDAAEEKYVGESDLTKPEGYISKVDAVYLSGNKTRDDIPSHLTIGKDVPSEVADLYSHMCPAGVYEVRDGKLVVNAPNCVDCKATDVLGPRWEPREGGSGPKYKMM